MHVYACGNTSGGKTFAYGHEKGATLLLVQLSELAWCVSPWGLMVAGRDFTGVTCWHSEQIYRDQVADARALPGMAHAEVVRSTSRQT